MAQAVTIENVTKVFGRRADAPVLERLSCTIGNGECVAVLGPSGSGKSTILRLIAGLEQPTQGSVRIGDRPVTSTDPRCAVVFQEPRLLPWRTVAHNVALGARRGGPDSESRIRALLAEVGLERVAGAWPHELSGGMAQRVGLARGLAAEPEILLLDEPFAALDALTRLRMQDLLLQLRQHHRQTIVLVTHDIDEALYLADRILVIGEHPARIVASRAVPLPQPRRRGDPALAALREEILGIFGIGASVEPQDTDCPPAHATGPTGARWASGVPLQT